jgi:hypothetical protein
LHGKIFSKQYQDILKKGHFGPTFFCFPQAEKTPPNFSQQQVFGMFFEIKISQLNTGENRTI